MGDTEDGSYTASQLGGYIRREEARKLGGGGMKMFENVDESVAEGKRILTVSGTVDEWRRLLGYNTHTTEPQVERQLQQDVQQAEYLSANTARTGTR